MQQLTPASQVAHVHEHGWLLSADQFAAVCLQHTLERIAETGVAELELRAELHTVAAIGFVVTLVADGTVADVDIADVVAAVLGEHDHLVSATAHTRVKARDVSG